MADSPCTMSAEAAETVKVEDGGDSDGPAPDRARRTLEEEFNTQRAKMKELFLQKEEEMRKLRQEKEHLESEVLSLRAELQQTQTLSENQKSEIQSLQLLVSETVEASSSGSEEARRLRARTLELEHQLAQLRQQQQEVSLAPATFVRSLARKLGADADDTPTRKAAEEGELARSLLAPLEQEVLALKAKLRDTDAQLQDAIAKAKATAATAASGDGNKEQEGARRCDMCANYEQQLVLEQAQAEAARERAQALDAALRLASDELEAVRALHDETIRAWADERARGSARLDQLQAAVELARRALEQRAAAAAAAEQRALTAVTDLTVERETLQRRLDSLERDNAMLIGQYTKRAADMQNEIIDLPDNVEELQEQTLRLREQLIFCEIGRSEASSAERSLRAQLLEQGALAHRREAALQALRAELRAAAEAAAGAGAQAEALRAARAREAEARDELRRARAELADARARLGALQQELDNSEKVQQDFVRLSQSLQVQLQRIREADAEVRWQHDEDVHECPSCRAPLPTSRKKVHCRHCGRIFCAACVAHAVPSGPRQLPARVCAVCRTLLQPHAAPYFSTQPPRSPD